jgi:hypothetical protein
MIGAIKRVNNKTIDIDFFILKAPKLHDRKRSTRFAVIYNLSPILPRLFSRVVGQAVP